MYINIHVCMPTTPPKVYKQHNTLIENSTAPPNVNSSLIYLLEYIERVIQIIKIHGKGVCMPTSKGYNNIHIHVTFVAPETTTRTN